MLWWRSQLGRMYAHCFAGARKSFWSVRLLLSYRQSVRRGFSRRSCRWRGEWTVIWHFWGARMAQWWERLPPTNVARVGFRPGAICGLSLFSSQFAPWVFLRVLGFPPSTKTSISKFQFDLACVAGGYLPGPSLHRPFRCLLARSTPTKPPATQAKFDQDRGPACIPAKADAASSLNVVNFFIYRHPWLSCSRLSLWNS